MTAFWHDLVTRKSWEVLTRLRSRYRFTLIGGWAIFLYAKTLKSKDIDLIVDYGDLSLLQREYPLTKNDRLRKYEAREGEVDIDIYTPHYSNPGLPSEEVLRHTRMIEGFEVPRPEVLLLLKQQAFKDRAGSPKGEKDRLDIVSLLRATAMEWDFYKAEALRHRPASPQELKELVEALRQAPELDLNAHQISRLKKTWRQDLGS